MTHPTNDNKERFDRKNYQEERRAELEDEAKRSRKGS